MTVIDCIVMNSCYNEARRTSLWHSLHGVDEDSSNKDCSKQKDRKRRGGGEDEHDEEQERRRRRKEEKEEEKKDRDEEEEERIQDCSLPSAKKMLEAKRER